MVIDLKQQYTRTEMNTIRIKRNGVLKEEGVHYIHFTTPVIIKKFHMVDGKFYVCENKTCGICDMSQAALNNYNGDLAMQYRGRWRLYVYAEIDDEDEILLFIPWFDLAKQFAKMVSGKKIKDPSFYDLKITTEISNMGSFKCPKYILDEIVFREDEWSRDNDIEFHLANEALTDDEIANFTKKLLV